MKCKNCGHELECSTQNNMLSIKHKKSRVWEGDPGWYYYCSETIVDCDKCKREHECDCRKPEPEVK